MDETPTTADLALLDRGAVTVSGARAEYGIGRSTLYTLIAQGEIRTIRRGRRRLIPRAELVRHLAEHLEPARSGSASGS